MGATGKFSWGGDRKSQNFKDEQSSTADKKKSPTYLELSSNLKKNELRTRFEDETGIRTSNTLFSSMTKQNLAEYYDNVKEIDDFTYNEFGVHLISDLNSGAKGAVAAADWASQSDKFPIELNNKYFNMAYLNSRMSSDSKGFHPISDNGIKSTIAHEIGHLLARTAVNREFSNISDIKKALYDPNSIWPSVDKSYRHWNTEWGRNLLAKAFKLKGSESDITAGITQNQNSISTYASYSYHECIAEAVSDYAMNGSKASSASIQIIKELKKRIK